MVLRNLIFGRRTAAPETPAPVADGAQHSPASAGNDNAEVAAPVEPEVQDLAETPKVEAQPDDAEDAPPTDAAPEPVAEAPIDRDRGLVLGAGLPLIDRRRAVVDELCLVLSLQLVSVTGSERSARLLVANRRVMAARFLGPDLPLDLDLRREPVSEAKAMVLHAALMELLAAPVDLQIERRPAAGVFAADAGLPAVLLGVDVAALCAAFTPPAEVSSGATQA